MIDYTYFFQNSKRSYLKRLLQDVMDKTEQVLNSNRFGDRHKWQAAIDALPKPVVDTIDLNADAITATLLGGEQSVINERIEHSLKGLIPWRKGPYRIGDTYIDTEWRSDFKWERLKDHISPLEDRVVLDVGCGNGYHCFRMLGAGAKLVMGIDPMLFYVYQFFALNHFFKQNDLAVLPLGLESLPDNAPCFDTVFSMGVMYHRRSPIDHIIKLRSLLKPGGELVLETLVIDDSEGDCLVPGERYAKMRNVWFIPGTRQLAQWLTRCGFSTVQQVDVNRTSVHEQRATPWMQYESLSDFLAPDNPSLTIEGYPAPRRAIFVCQK